jgi:hypothetical protein
MDERDRRVGRNEALFRQVNEEIETLERSIAAISDDMVHIVCECGDLRCNERVAVPVRTYEQVRADPPLFFVLPGHVAPSAESVVATEPGYQIVRKRDGGPAQAAQAADPRP